MKPRMLATAGALLLTIPLLLLLGGVNGSDISHIDPTGDVENEGMPADIASNVDIISLSLDTSGDPYIFELEVDGIAIYNASAYTYFYFIHLDQVGDGSESTTVTISMGTGMFISDYGSGAGFGLTVSGNGTDTITLEIGKSSIDATNHPIEDIYALAEVSDLSSGWAEDYINEDFGDDIGDVDDDDIEPDDDDDDFPNIDDYYATDKEYEDPNDPDGTTPSDPSINIDITSFEYTYEEQGGREEWEETMIGTSSDVVLYGAFSKVFYYKNGSHNEVEWLMGAYNMPRTTINDATHESHFKGTGPGGKEDWTAWEMYFYGERAMDPEDPAGLKEACVDIDEVDRVVIFVRVFSDENLTQWNQDSVDVTDDYMDPDIINAGGGVSGDDDDVGDDSPGFELILLVPTIVLLVMVCYHTKRNR